MLLQDIFGVPQEGGVHEAQAQIFPEGPDQRHVATDMHIAGMAPFAVLVSPVASAMRRRVKRPAAHARVGHSGVAKRAQRSQPLAK